MDVNTIRQAVSEARDLSRQHSFHSAVARLERCKHMFTLEENKYFAESAQGKAALRTLDCRLEPLLNKLKHDPYAALKLPSRDVSLTQVKKSYRKLVLMFHPDKSVGTLELFHCIQQAFEKLRTSPSILSRVRQPCTPPRRQAPRRHNPSWKPQYTSSFRKPEAKKREPEEPHHQPFPKRRDFNRNSFSSKRGDAAAPPQTSSAYSSRQNNATSGSYSSKYSSSKSSSQGATGSSDSSRNARDSEEKLREFWKSVQQSDTWSALKRAAVAQARREAERAKERAQNIMKQNSEANSARRKNSQSSKPAAPPPVRARGPPAPKLPFAPQKLSVCERETTSITLSWSVGLESNDTANNKRAPPVAPITAYELQWREGIFPWKMASDRIRGTVCRKKNLEPGREYGFRVRAKNAVGWGPFCEMAAWSTKCDKPSQPSITELVSDSPTSVLITWDAPLAHGAHVEAYSLQWRTYGSGNDSWNVGSKNIHGTSCRKRNLTSGVTFEFRIRAKNKVGWSHWSNPGACTVIKQAGPDIVQEPKPMQEPIPEPMPEPMPEQKPIPEPTPEPALEPEIESVKKAAQEPVYSPPKVEKEIRKAEKSNYSESAASPKSDTSIPEKEPEISNVGLDQSGEESNTEKEKVEPKLQKETTKKTYPEERDVPERLLDEKGRRLPQGWEKVESRSRPGEFSYMNVVSGQRQIAIPRKPAMSKSVPKSKVEEEPQKNENESVPNFPEHLLDTNGQLLPKGWRKVASRSRPGEYSYQNLVTGQRQTVIPTEPAIKANVSPKENDDKEDKTVPFDKNVDTLGHPLPPDWIRVESRSRPGEFSYENIRSGKRQIKIPVSIKEGKGPGYEKSTQKGEAVQGKEKVDAKTTQSWFWGEAAEKMSGAGKTERKGKPEPIRTAKEFGDILKAGIAAAKNMNVSQAAATLASAKPCTCGQPWCASCSRLSNFLEKSKQEPSKTAETSEEPKIVLDAETGLPLKIPGFGAAFTNFSKNDDEEEEGEFTIHTSRINLPPDALSQASSGEETDEREKEESNEYYDDDENGFVGEEDQDYDDDEEEDFIGGEAWLELRHNGNVYYYNTFTGESRWEQPPENDGIPVIREKEIQPTMSSDANEEGDYDYEEEYAYEGQNFEADNEIDDEFLGPEEVKEEWVAGTTEEGHIYYVNSLTGESKWAETET